MYVPSAILSASRTILMDCRTLLLILANPQILLVPTTEVLLTSRDTESNTLYVDLAGSEEFLGSHVLRLPGGGVYASGKDSPNMRDSRGKAKQFTTLNGRTVVVKDSFVYSNKGWLIITNIGDAADMLMWWNQASGLSIRLSY